MNTRILHCGDNLQNYYLCIEKQVAGFIRLAPSEGDLVYLAVKHNGISYIGARFTLDKPTNIKPWPDAKNYKFAYSIKNIEYCKPFNFSGLAKFGGTYWAAKYIQSSKPIKDEGALQFLNEQFCQSVLKSFTSF
jgi:hypothetical protein